LQAEAREKERLKEETRKQRKMESGFKTLLKSSDIDYETSWDEARAKLEGDPAFDSIMLESERIRIYKVCLIFIFCASRN
jgi:pre-mRNA-processing factor 40